MTTLSEASLYWLLRLAQHTPFHGNNNAFAGGEPGSQRERFPQARLEAENYSEFVGFFGDRLPDLAGKAVLDLGSGYGGKTVELARRLGARTMVGIEPYSSMVKRAVAYGRSVGADNVEFRHCAHLNIPAADQEFDVILSHDVIEHVENPSATLAEMHRVLRPGGDACIVFTPYWGALSHHLGYVCRAPFVHWIYSPKTIVNAVNRMLASEEGERFGTAQQPAPKKKFNGGRDVLPTLNGVGGEEFLDLARRTGFEVRYVRYPTIAARFAPKLRLLDRVNGALMRLHPFLREGLSYNLTCILTKRPAGDLSA